MSDVPAVSSVQYPYSYQYDADGYPLRPTGSADNIFGFATANSDIVLSEWKVMFGDDPGGSHGTDPFLSKDFPSVREHYSHDDIMNGTFGFPSGISFGDMLQEAGTAISKVIKAAAPFIAMIPGVGTIVGAGLYAIGSIGAGDRIDTVAIATIKTALPEELKTPFQEAVDIGYGLARGQRVDKITVDLTRKTLAASGGPKAVAAFDAGLSIGTGKGLQDAGFKVLGVWAAGTNSDERAASFLAATALAAAQGKSVQQVLYAAAQSAFFQAIPAAQQAYVLEQAIDYFLAHPTEVLDPDEADLAERLGIPIEAIQAALICIQQMADGTITVNGDYVNSFNQKLLPPVASIGMSSEGSPGTNDAYVANTALAAKGRAIQAGDHTALVQRGMTSYAGIKTNDDWRRGYDIGTAVAYGHSLDGPGQQAVRATLHSLAKASGYDAAQKYQYQRTVAQAVANALIASVPVSRQQQITAMQAAGSQAAQNDPQLMTARSSNKSIAFQRGFDVATIGCAGTITNGPGQDAMRADLLALAGGLNSATGRDVTLGFDVGQSVQHGIAQSRANGTQVSSNPSIATGQLVVQGLAGSGVSANQKAAVVGAVIANSTATRAAVTAAIPTVAPKGFFARFFAFLGF